jgi:putative phosphoribosyl transferase
MMHLPFTDRTEAGRLLAREIALRKFPASAAVLAVAPGGVPAGYAVADRLRLPLDIVVTQKIPVPWQRDLSMGTLAGSTYVLDSFLVHTLGIPEEDLDELIASARAETRENEKRCRGAETGLAIEGLFVILTDDGMATGDSMVAAVREMRQRKAESVTVAVPVSSRHALERLKREADSLVCLAVPEYFVSTGEWYHEYPQIGATEVRKLLDAARCNLGKDLFATRAA